MPLSGREKYRKKCAEMTPDQVLVERAKARERMRVYREKKMKGGATDLGDEPITTSSVSLHQLYMQLLFANIKY